MKYRFFLVAAVFLLSRGAYGQRGPALSAEESAISAQIGGLRSLPDEVWKETVGKLARQIQQLPAGSGKETLIGRLGNLVTEGDAGHDAVEGWCAPLVPPVSVVDVAGAVKRDSD